jgi:FKBP-type peptidyl-prolyl cis-trans isomerase (trigger factor)
MSPQKYRKTSLKEETHAKVVEVSNILKLSVPDTVDELASQFLTNKKSREDLKELQERETRGS